ncbi:MAG: 30S ribosomal protein S6 [Acidobacteriota bacterium]|nr:30S ribosomal protein S6 [Acidobacteriota bacterium]MDH3529646.1 30S ribosomal protein S6 [Acidobacteriota bacterium]
MANNRVYELMYIADPTVEQAKIGQLNSEIESLIETEGGKVVNTDDMGRRPLAYRIKQFTEGYYFLFEIEGSGREIAELERRLRVNDKVVRYLTVRVDEERKAAEKIEAKRATRKEKLKSALGSIDDGGEEEE